jgi:hypothetical protein
MAAITVYLALALMRVQGFGCFGAVSAVCRRTALALHPNPGPRSALALGSRRACPPPGTT